MFPAISLRWKKNNMWDFQTLSGKAAKEPIMLLDEWWQHMAPVAHPLLYLLIKIFGLIRTTIWQRHTLCVQISYRSVSHQHVKSTYLARTCTWAHKQIWNWIRSSDKKLLHANLFQRIQARSSEINIATGLQTFPREFLRITFKIWSDIFWKN